MRWARRLVLGVVLFVPRPARGDDAPGFDATTWRPGLDNRALLVSEPTAVPRAWLPALGASAAYAVDPVRLPGSASPLEQQLLFEAFAVVGIGLRSSLGASLPVPLRLAGSAGLPADVVGGGEVPTIALGDARVSAKTSILSADEGGLGLALRATLSLPVGSPRSFAAESAVAAEGHALAEYNLLVAGVRASVGFKGRAEQEIWPAGAPFAQVGNELPFRLAGWLRPAVLGDFGRSLDGGDRQTWELGLRGSLPAGPVAPGGAGASAVTPLLVSAADRITLGAAKDWFVLAGLDVGLGSAVGVPVVRGIVTFGWAPSPADSDGDGVPDAQDECPELPGAPSPRKEDNGCPAFVDEGAPPS